MGKGRILVVEDDADISNMLRIYFTSQGYEVVAVMRGGEAGAVSAAIAAGHCLGHYAAGH